MIFRNIFKKKTFHSIILIGGSQASTYVLSFFRNVIMARILTKEDFGLIALFALTISLLDLNSRMGISRQVVQHPSGDSKQFLGTAHVFQLITGFISSLGLLLISYPIALILKVPDKTWAFALLSIVPLIRSVNNLDVFRKQREFNFNPSISSELIPQFIITVLTFPLCKLIGNFSVILVLVIVRSFLSMIITHVVSSTPYKLGWNKNFALQMWRFSWPLLINGFLMYFSQKGDRLIIGATFSLDILALYSAAIMFITVPYMIMANVSNSILLPLLSKVQNNISLFKQKYSFCLELSSLLSVITMVPFIVSSEQIITLIFGQKYSGGGPLLSLLAMAAAFRFLRITPATAAMALADTKNNMFSNLIRFSSLIFIFIVILFNGDIKMYAGFTIFGEIISFFGSVWLLNKTIAIPFSIICKSPIYVSSCLILSISSLLFGAFNFSIFSSFMLSFIVIIICLLLSLLFFSKNFLCFFKSPSNSQIGLI